MGYFCFQFTKQLAFSLKSSSGTPSDSRLDCNLELTHVQGLREKPHQDKQHGGLPAFPSAWEVSAGEVTQATGPFSECHLVLGFKRRPFLRYCYPEKHCFAELVSINSIQQPQKSYRSDVPVFVHKRVHLNSRKDVV